MKRVPLNNKDYPENFNKVAKYIGKNWIDKTLTLEQSRQLLAKAIGYNSVYELEKSFMDKLPNLIDINALISQIKYKMKDIYEQEWREGDQGFHLAHAKWEKFKDGVFPKIPFYLFQALDESKEDIFGGIYDKVADRMSLLIQNHRFGGYYGIFTHSSDVLPDIDHNIYIDKTSNLYSFFEQYECFPFGSGNSHISVITQIKERVEKYFDMDGVWKLRVVNPDGHELQYYEVINEILSWFDDDKSSKGSGWYVIDGKRQQSHWLFAALDDAVEKLKNNNFERININASDISDEDPHNPHRPYLFLDEGYHFPAEGMPELLNAFRGLPSKTDSRQASNKKDTGGMLIRDGDLVIDEDGKSYKVDRHIKSKSLFIYELSNIDNQIPLDDFQGDLTIVNPFVAIQSIKDFKQ